MALSLRDIRAVTLSVANLERSKRWYTEGRGPAGVFEDEHSAVFRPAAAVVNLLVATEAGELIAPAALGRAGTATSQLTIDVNNVRGACPTLTQRGVTLLNNPVDLPWGARTAAFTDRDGPHWEFAEQLP